MAPRIRKKFRESRHYNRHPDYIEDVTAFNASRLIAATNNLVRKSDDGCVLMKLFTLKSLVSQLTPFKATKSHDIIYAILSLARDIPSSAAVITPTTVVKTSVSTVMTVTDADAATPEERALLERLRVTDRLRVQKYPVKYRKTFYKVCRDFLDFSTRKSRSLDIICRP
jgi:hypothetical protein